MARAGLRVAWWGDSKANGNRQTANPVSLPGAPLTAIPDLAPESGNFEKVLTMMKNPQAYPPNYDPNYGYYQPQYGMPPYMTPPSPQPRPGMPFNPNAGFMPGAQYPVHPPPTATPLSRTPSQVSTDRPGSSLGQGPATSGPPAAGHAHTSSRSSNSPAPAKSQFVIPPKKSAIVIKDPSGNVKNFNAPASPARATPSPVKITTPSSTPPPRTASASDHTRSDSKAGNAKTDDEKKQELKNAVLKKVQEDEAAQKRQAEEADRKPAEAAEPAKKDDTESAREALEGLDLKEKSAPAEEPKKVEEPKPKETQEPKKAPVPAPPADEEEEIDFDAIEREMAEIEAKERAAEEDYNQKKKEKKEAEERKEREERESYEANMKKLEAEAEEREIAKETARAKGETGDKDLFESLKSSTGFQATESSTPGDSGTATPVSSDMGPPPKPTGAPAKKPTGLKVETVKSTEPTAAMKALQNAKFLEDLSKISYPASIKPPNTSLNADSPSGRQFHYDRDFLLQFQSAYKDKPSADWDLRVRDTVGDADSSRPQSARTPSMGGRGTSRPGSTPMGSFATRPPSLNGPPRGMTGFGGGFPNPIPGRGGIGGMGSRTPSGVGSAPRPGGSKGPRDGSRRGGKNPGRREEEHNKTMPLTAGMDLKAITTSETGWKPRSVAQAPTAGPAPGEASTHLTPDMVQRKVKAALSKKPLEFPCIQLRILKLT